MKKTDSESFKLKPEFQLDHGIELQNTRIFKEDGSSVVYMKGSVIRPECGGDVGMLIPSIEFKYFVQAVKKGYFVEKFLKETLRFACGCLNRRCNGTIYFGVADDKEVDGQKYKHGEIVGFPINNIESENIMSTFTDKLDHAKENYFSSDSKRAAKECISSPRFVLVQPSTRELPGYVMEVDIEPSIIFCEGVIFRVDLSKFGEKNKKSVVCVRDGASTKYIEDKRDKEIFTLSLKKYDKKRNQEESIGPKHLKKVRSHKYLAEKLCFKLCKGSAAFDQSLWPILLCNKPTLEKKRTLFKHLSFIEHIKWSAVMDFDDESCIDGLYRHLFVSSKTKEIDCTHFRNISSTDRFRSDLELAEKIAYIFCNGRQEIDLPHGSEKFWEEKYSPGVKGAVNFLQQDSIIPVDRSIVVFLLLSTDFAGYVDTLKEIKTYFPVDNILLLCEDDKIFEAFKQTSLPRNIASEEELEKFSIVGMSFEQVSNVVKKLLCIQQNSLVLIPSSTRVEVEVEKQFSDSHDCLSILASNECETKQFDTDLEKMQFAHSKDLRFYQGNRVEWWNFHFEGHVVKRSCFDNLKEKVEDALRGSHSENMSVLTIYLTHEPGAGGSTLAKHILWEFRKRHRCAIIKKLTEKTATDIVDLWKYKEIKEEHAVPVLLLIDSLEIKEKELYVIHQLIGKEMRKRESKNQTPVCVFIVCNRDAELTFAKASAHMDAKYREYLLQGVDTREQELFKKKIKDLDEVSHALGIDDFKAEHFLSFMILHSNFNPEYIQQTTKTLLQTMDPESKSYELLKCVALFVAFVDPPKGGAPTAIPLECCDSLMGCESHFEKKTKTLRWESNLERAIKILLRIEKKEYGSGEEIRMAHPILAREVIECMKHQNKHYDAQDVKETALSKIVMKVLESKLLQSRSYSIKLVKGLIVQMLTKRKKEEYGDADTSKFSPLIESIQEENPSVCEPAIAVLQKAFDVIGDGSISQQMARLYLSHHNHLDAKKWAQKAVDLCPSRSPFIHTLGHVYKETFKSSKLYQGKAYLDPNDEQFSLELNNVFKALEYFIKAIWNENEINLFACFDTVETINIIVEFISKFLDQNQKKQFYRYLTEDSYDFDFIDKSYLSCYRLMLKQFFDQGMQAIHDLDEHIFFKVKIYASQFHSMFSKEHHTSRVIKKRLPKLIRRFFDVFCEDSDVKPSYVQSPEMEDEWHRRCVLRSQAKRLIGMCSFVHQCFVERHCDKARRVLEKAYDHLVDIKSKDSSDLLGLLIINFANVQLKADKSDKIKISMHELVKYCQFVISNGTKKQKREGHLFALMLSWPRNEKDDVQKYKLIEKAMHFLASGFKDSQETRLTYEVEYGDYFKRERNMVRSIPLFYEAVGTGLACLKYQDEVLDSKHFQDIREDFWERKSAIFRPLEGIARIAPNGSAYIQLGHEDNMIKLRLFKCRKPSSERKVIFYLGFTAFGPAVVYIKPENKLLDSLEIYDDKPDYENKSEEELKKLLEDIKTAKQSLKQKQKLTPYQNKSLKPNLK